MGNGTPINDLWQFCYTSDDNCETDSTCSSKESLEKIVEEFFDTSRTNPRNVAEELDKAGCTFFCHYREYKANLLLTKQDSSIQEDHLQLSFELGQDSYSMENVHKDLDYSVDMFVSDLGNGFGFLLGLSLLGVIGILMDSVGSVGRSFLQAENLSLTAKSAAQMTYTILKWTLVTSFVTYLSISGIVKDFSNLLSFYGLSSANTGPMTSNAFLKSNSEVGLEWGFLSNSLNSTICPLAAEVDDGFCDDKANTEDCNFDGGDCCRPGVERKPNSHWFCTDCKCHSAEGQRNDQIKPGKQTQLKRLFVALTDCLSI